MSPYQSPAPTALAPPGTYLAGGGPAAVSVGATEDAGPKVVIDVESVAFILNAELGRGLGAAEKRGGGEQGKDLGYRA